MILPISGKAAAYFIGLDFLYGYAICPKMCYTISVIWFHRLNHGGLSVKGRRIVEIQKQLAALAVDFAACSQILTAIGDETRQHLILEMLKMGQCNGVRVCEITKKTNLSRPAVSHHLQIMKNAGLVKVRKEGTKNYYYFDPEMASMAKLITTLQLAVELSQALPDRSGEEA